MSVAKRKTKTSTEVKARYNQKTYDIVSVRVPKEMAEAFKAKCVAEGIPQAQIIKQAIPDRVFRTERTLRRLGGVPVSTGTLNQG